MPHSHLGARLPDTDKASVLFTWKTEVCESRWPRGGVSKTSRSWQGLEVGGAGRRGSLKGAEGSCLVRVFFSKMFHVILPGASILLATAISTGYVAWPTCPCKTSLMVEFLSSGLLIPFTVQPAKHRSEAQQLGPGLQIQQPGPG